MKYAMLVVAVMFALCAGTTFASDGQISKSQLSEMGIPGLQVMSDVQGLEIRGMAARAWGNAYASTRFSSADAHYSARGRRLAGGAALAVASGPRVTSWAVGASIAVSR